MEQISRITRMPLREVWQHEAHGFTKWLEENIDALNDVLDFTISPTEREAQAGDFAVDLLGETDDGDVVVIENQFGRSNHDHLGKLVTYLAARDAKVAIWLVEDPRPEHVAAINWLNEFSPVRFYLIKAEGIRIGESPSAALFTPIVYPSEEMRTAGKSKIEESERHKYRRLFWTHLLEMAKQHTKLHATVTPSKNSWISVSAGVGGLGLNYVVRRHSTRVELYLSRKEASENKAVFDQLFARQSSIEKDFGAQLEWERLDGKKACRIAFKLNQGGWMDEERWDSVISSTVDAMIRLHGALKDPLKTVKV